MLEVLQEGWAQLERLPESPSAEDAFFFVQRVSAFQGLFKPGQLRVRHCEVEPDGNGEIYRGILQARPIVTPGHVPGTETIVVRATFKRASRERDGSVRYRCTHLSIGRVRLTDGVVKDRGSGLDITYSAFDARKSPLAPKVRILGFPNGWRRNLRSVALAMILDWQLQRTRDELAALQAEQDTATS